MTKPTNIIDFLYQAKMNRAKRQTKKDEQTDKKPDLRSRSSLTLSQITALEKLKLATKLVQSMKSLIRITFTQYNKKKHTPFSAASSLVHKEVITGLYPELKINWEDLPVSKGRLPRIYKVNIVPVPGKIIYTWGMQDISDADPNDRVILIMYLPWVFRCVNIFPEARRRTGYAIWDTSLFEKEKVHLYLTLLSDDEKNSSDPMYLGEIELL